MTKAWAILTEQGVAVAAWVSHSAALAESGGLPVVPCVINVSQVDRKRALDDLAVAQAVAARPQEVGHA